MSGQRGKKILVVDDEASILLSLSYVLRAEGVEVITCSEIELAEAALAATHFDLVLADIRMSGVSGIEGLELLSYIKKHFNTEVIIMTGYGTPEIEEEAYRRGAFYYFKKPIDIPQLLRQVSTLEIPVKH
jgi:DNA-binding NtrC family response regulator